MFVSRVVAAAGAAALLSTSIVLPSGVAGAADPGSGPRPTPISARVASTPWSCAPVFFQSAERSDDSSYQKLYEYSPTTNKFTGIGPNQPNIGTQVLGYNTADNYLYELVNYRTTGDDTRMDLIRIDDSATYSLVNAWSVPSQFNVGDFWNGSPSHSFVVGGDYTNSWRLVDVRNVNNSATQASADFTITGSGSGAYFRGKDMTILGDTGYGLHDDTLYILNLNTRTVSTKSVTFSGGGRGASDGFGSAYADALGNLYFFENSTSQVWRLLAEDVKQSTPTLSKVGSGPAYVSGTVNVRLKAPNDGASCPNARSPYSATISAEAATSVTDDTATLTATVNPNNIPTTARLCYGLSAQRSGGRLVGCTLSRQFANADDTTLLTGNSAVSLSPLDVTGLSSRTTYYWQVVTTSSWATTYGDVATFTTTSAPVVSTSPASGVTSSSATLNGLVNSGGRSTTVNFCFGTAPDLTGCTNVDATQSPLGASTDDTSVSATLGSLAPGTTYYARVAATNADGSASGSIVAFTTSATPLVSLGAATDVTSTDARLAAQVNPKGLSTTVSFCWGTAPDLTGCATTNAAQSPLIPVDDSVSASADLTGLTPATTYYARVSATNGNGTTTSSIGSFTTAAAPLVLSTTTGALPPATVGTAYSKTLTAGGGVAPYTWAVASGTLPAGLTLNSASGVISGTPTVEGSTSFVVRVTDATSATATRTFSISTGSPPTATTFSATSVSGTTVTLNGRVDPGNLQTAVSFCYGTSPTLAGCTSISAAQSPLGASTDDTSVSVDVTGLAMGTTYFARVTATNGAGSASGSIVTFTTTNVPSVVTGTATFLRSAGTVATLNGTVNPNGLSTSVSFCYGTTPTLTGCTSQSGGTLIASRTSSPVSVDISGLSANTVYYFTVLATNSLGVTAGSTTTFTMPSASAAGPTIGSVAPTTGPVAGGTSVVISGTNFSTSSKPTVLFDDSTATSVTVNSATSITATSPAFAYPGAVDVIVSNPDGQAARKVDAFTYTSPVRYTVTYQGNGSTSGSVPTDATAYPYDDTVTVAAAGTMARSGYDFSGWNTAPSGTGAGYAAGSTFRIASDDTLYAQWTPIVIDALSDDTLTFAAQPISSPSEPQVVSLVNEGAASMTVSAISVAGLDDSDFEVTGGTCGSGAIVTGKASCTIDVTFDPTQVGARSAALQVTTSAGSLSSALQGTGTTAASPGLTPSSVNFGSRDVAAGPSAAQTVTLTNSGGSAMSITSVSVTGADPGDFARSGGTCANGATVAASASCTINVTFDPTQVGARSASLSALTSAGTVTAGLTGTGTGVSPSPTPSPPIPRVPGVPRDVIGTPGDSAVIVAWTPPGDPGSFAISDYQVEAEPGGASCRVEASTTQCVITGLTNGTAYAFRVRALNGAGWGAYSSWSEPVTPEETPASAIVIVGGRDPNAPQRVLVSGTAVRLAGGSVLPHVRMAGQLRYRVGVRPVSVDATGSFEWRRRSIKPLRVYFSGGGVRSRTIYIAAAPR